MRIWVDGQCFQTRSNLRGIGRYAADLLRAIDRTGEAQLIISLNGNMAEEAIAARNYLKRAVPGAKVVVWYGIAHKGELDAGYTPERKTDEQMLAAHINAIAPDIALSPSPFEGQVDCSSPFIRTDEIEMLTACIFHDAIPYRFAEVYLRDAGPKKLYMRKFEQINKFDLVLCNSHFTGKEYNEIYNAFNNVVIGAGLSEHFVELLGSWRFDANSRGASLGHYVLYVGGMDWHKNVRLLAQAMARTPECVAGKLKLVLAGYNSEGLVAPIVALWKQRGLPAENLVWTDWVSDEDLVDLYRNAAVMVQPSLMEGFGLSALEAMAAGCPFLSSRGGAVAEVVANEELLFDPESPPELARLMSRMLNDAPFRERMVAFGLERSRSLTWEATARTALDAMRNAVEGAGRTPQAKPKETKRRDPPRILMDVSSTAQSPVMSGIQRVMHKLSEAMLQQNEKEKTQTVLSYCRDEHGWYELPHMAKSALSLDPRCRISFKDNDTYFLLDSSWNFTHGQRRRLIDALLLGQEVVHGIHDIGPLTMLAMTDKGMPPAFREWFEFILGHSTGIVCVSRAVADEVYELVQAIKLPRPMKIGYFRLGGNFADAPADDSWLNFTGGRPTFLMVGTIEPRKAHSIALEAFERLWLEGVDVNLLIIGNVGWDTKLLRARLEAHPEAERRLFVRSGLSDGALRAAYGAATALIMTSYLEGFGLPVVEAGHLGCPVILNDIPVFREVGHGAPAARFFRRGELRRFGGRRSRCRSEWLRKLRQSRFRLAKLGGQRPRSEKSAVRRRVASSLRAEGNPAQHASVRHR